METKSKFDFLNASVEPVEPPTTVVTTERIEPPPLPRPAKAAHPFSVMVLYLCAVFLGAALVAPRFHASVLFLAEGGSPFWTRIAQQPFHRYVGRALILLALVGLPLFIKALRIPSRRALGLSFYRRNWGEGLLGLAWGCAALSITGALAVSFGARTWNLDHEPAEYLRHFRNTMFAAMLVATIEELLFRGALFGSFRRRYSFWPAALISSSVYALLHFFEHPQQPASIEWFSGFTTLGQMLGGFTQWQTLLPGFLNLALIGVILALALERTNSLLFSIGLHASLVFCVKTFGFLSVSVATANTQAWGSAKLIDGWATGLILLLGFLALRALLPNPQEKE